MEAQIRRCGRVPSMRTTLYQQPPKQQREAALTPLPLTTVSNASAGKLQRSKRIEIVEVPTLSKPEAVWQPPQQVFLMDACN